MVQVQSTWFPLYDRNPQNFVENIFNARPGDYQVATQRVYESALSIAGDFAGDEIIVSISIGI
jgi:predicted acyl esterase